MEKRKRKALADITNAYNLIPTSELRKLVASSSSNSNSNSVSKPPFSILRSDSNPPKSCSESEPSIASSNLSTTRTVRFRGITDNGELGSKDAAYHRRQSVGKLSSEGKDDVVIVGMNPAGDRKGKGKPVAVQLSSAQAPVLKTTESRIGNACSLLDKTNQKERTNLFGPAQKVKEFGNGILNPSSCSYEKTANQKLILDLSGCSLGKEEQVAKDVGNYSSPLLEKTIDERKGILKHSGPSNPKLKDIGKKILYSSSSMVEKTRGKEMAHRSFDISNEKTMEKGKAVLHPFDLDEKAEHEESSAKCLPPRGNTKSLAEKPRQKHKANLLGGPVEKVNEFGKVILNSYGSSCENTGKRNLGGSSSAKIKETGKGIGSYSSFLFEKAVDERKGIHELSDSLIERSKEMGTSVLNPSSSLGEKTKGKEKSLHSFDSSNEKTIEKREAILHHLSLDKAAKHNESSANCLPPRSRSSKRKHCSETSSCPPVLRTKTVKNELYEAGNSKSSKSYTDPRPKCTKKRCPRTEGLRKSQQEEIEQLNKYFDELKGFELPEEFASDDD